jgi:hypothetical protein
MPVYDDKATKKANKEKSRCRGLSVFSASLFSSKRNLHESAYPLFPDFQGLMNARGVETAHEQMILQCCHPSSIPVVPRRISKIQCSAAAISQKPSVFSFFENDRYVSHQKWRP